MNSSSIILALILVDIQKPFYSENALIKSNFPDFGKKGFHGPPNSSTRSMYLQSVPAARVCSLFLQSVFEVRVCSISKFLKTNLRMLLICWNLAVRTKWKSYTFEQYIMKMFLLGSKISEWWILKNGIASLIMTVLKTLPNIKAMK